MPDVFASCNFRHGAPGGHARDAIVDEHVAVLRLRKIIGDLLQHPRLCLFTRPRLQAKHHPLALHSLAFEREVEMPLLDRFAWILARLRDPAPTVPEHHRPAAIFALRDRPLEVAIIERMILGSHREAFLVWIEAWTLGYGPAFQ